MTIDIFQALGAATQQINFSELYVALQQGVVDGQENPLANIHSVQAVRGEQIHLAVLAQVGVLPLPGLAHRLGPAERGRPQPRSRGRRRRPTSTPRSSWQETDAKLLAEYRANPALAVNEVDQAPFRAATAPVLEKWEQRPFGDFVKQLRAAAVA